ncbi:MAG: class I SAM-dependent methyltransferase [Acidimicrobiia bacterium]
MPVHRVADSGFDAEAASYERAHPGYPPDCVAWLAEHLGIGPGRDVLDLAAGTGKLTRLLEPYGGRLVAAEPVTGMRSVLHATSPTVPVVSSTAELLPFREGSLDAIVVAQAFHWFDAPVALAEAARVLRARGRLGLVWNARDRSLPHVDALWSIMDRVEKQAPWRNHEEWRESAFTDTPYFGPLHAATFHHEQLMTVDEVVDRFRSVSHVAVLPATEKEAVLAEVRDCALAHPDPVHPDRVGIPYRVDAYWCETT